MLCVFPWKTCPEIITLISAIRPPLFACRTTINAVVRPPWNACSCIKCCCMEICLDFCASNQQQAVRPASVCVQQNNKLLPQNLCQKSVRLPRKTCHKLLYGFCLGNCAKSSLNCVPTLLYGLAEILPWNMCQAAASFSSLLRNVSCSFALLLPIYLWKNEWPFPPFPPLT